MVAGLVCELMSLILQPIPNVFLCVEKKSQAGHKIKFQAILVDAVPQVASLPVGRHGVFLRLVPKPAVGTGCACRESG